MGIPNLESVPETLKFECLLVLAKWICSRQPNATSHYDFHSAYKSVYTSLNLCASLPQLE